MAMIPCCKDVAAQRNSRTFVTGATRDTEQGKPDFEGFLSEFALVNVDTYTLRERSLAWAGGLFEGEGYIGFHLKQPCLQLKSTDEDTVRHFAEIIGAGKVYGPYEVKETADHKRKSKWRPYFSWQVHGEKALVVAILLYPHLQSRRRAVLREKWGVERLAIVAGISPLVIKQFGEYMLKHQIQADGTTRSSNNWKKGIPLDAYIASAWRHFQTVRLHHEKVAGDNEEPLVDALCGLLFNVQGYLHELLKMKHE